MLIFHLLATSFSKKAKSDIYWQKCSLAISVGFKLNAMFPSFFYPNPALNPNPIWEQCPYDTGNKSPYDTGNNAPIILGTMPLGYWEQMLLGTNVPVIL